MAGDYYRVLALDGGGIRGIIPALVLAEIEQAMGRPIADMFDLIAGTSTGGILALGLATPVDRSSRVPKYSAQEMCDLYLQEGSRIFPHTVWHEITSLHGLADAKYPSEPIEDVLHERFGETMLSEALREVVITSYDLTAPAPFFFKTEYARRADQDWDLSMRFVARATSAAPTYFEPAVLPGPGETPDHALIDGGTFANDPALAAYVDALRLKREDQRLLVVSIGTGRPPQVPGSGPIPILPKDAGDFGLAKWARPILEVVLDGVPKAVEYQMSALGDLAGQAVGYLRLQSNLPTASHALDDASAANCARLEADARTLIEDEQTTLEKIYELLR